MLAILISIDSILSSPTTRSGMEQIAFASGEKAQVQSVLLLTDGLANEGIKTKDGILAEMTKLQSPPPAEVASKVSAYILCSSQFRNLHNLGITLVPWVSPFMF